MEEHLHHISQQLDRLQAASLKLKPSKCHFGCQQVEYLGHLITPQGLLPNLRKISAVADFPTPMSVTQVRQFVGLAFPTFCSWVRQDRRAFAQADKEGRGVQLDQPVPGGTRYAEEETGRGTSPRHWIC